MGEINECGALQTIFIYRFERTVIKIVSLCWVLMAPVIPEKVSC